MRGRIRGSGSQALNVIVAWHVWQLRKMVRLHCFYKLAGRARAGSEPECRRGPEAASGSGAVLLLAPLPPRFAAAAKWGSDDGEANPGCAVGQLGWMAMSEQQG
jgi:hypothetical protein